MKSVWRYNLFYIEVMHEGPKCLGTEKSEAPRPKNGDQKSGVRRENWRPNIASNKAFAISWEIMLFRL